jgi:hypothetical protein
MTSSLCRCASAISARGLREKSRGAAFCHASASADDPQNSYIRYSSESRFRRDSRQDWQYRLNDEFRYSG